MKVSKALKGVNIEPLMVGLIAITFCTKIGEYAWIATIPKKESKPATAAVKNVRLKSTCRSRMGASACFSIRMNAIHATSEKRSWSAPAPNLFGVPNHENPRRRVVVATTIVTVPSTSILGFTFWAVSGSAKAIKPPATRIKGIVPQNNPR